MKPFIEQRADPYIIRKDGWYYFTASAPEFDRIILRKARTLAGLPDAVEKIVWTRHAEGPLSCNIWAPELHFVDGKWYIYFAAARGGADEAGVFDHRIYALENDDPDPMSGGFTEAGRINTGWESFSLDSTTVVYDGKRYFIWAQRDFDIPGNSNLYIAEMKNALSIARKNCRGKLWAVMQPHTFSRVRTLFDQYLTCTKEADYTLVTDICAAREPDPGDLNSGMLVEGMRRNGIDAVWTPSFDDTEAYLRTHWQPGDLVLTMGCGDINLLNDQIHRHYTEAQGKEAGQ